MSRNILKKDTMDFFKKLLNRTNSLGSNKVTQDKENLKVVIQVKFERWDYNTAKELERLAMTIPIINEKAASIFFKEASQATGGKQATTKRSTGNVFKTIQGFISACERQDLQVDCLSGTCHMTHGIMRVEAFDTVMGALFVVARFTESEFYFEAFIGERNKNAVKSLFLNSLSVTS